VQKEPMLQTTFTKLSRELEQLKSVERGVIAKIIDTARELGDLKMLNIMLLKINRGL